jgi:hypothetical protein
MPRPCHAVAWHREVAFGTVGSEHGMGTAWARHGHGMVRVNQTRSQCVNQMGKTEFKPLAPRHDRGMAWARHAMCELVFISSRAVSFDALGSRRYFGVLQIIITLCPGY